jgi:hypothetical protein
MDLEKAKADLAEINMAIGRLQQQAADLRAEVADFVAEFKVGERVTLGGDLYVVTRIRFATFSSVQYRGVKVRKNGKNGVLERWLYNTTHRPMVRAEGAK